MTEKVDKLKDEVIDLEIRIVTLRKDYEALHYYAHDEVHGLVGANKMFTETLSVINKRMDQMDRKLDRIESVQARDQELQNTKKTLTLRVVGALITASIISIISFVIGEHFVK